MAGDDPAKAKARPKPEDFLGKWSGKWDARWKVQFTVTQDPKTQELTVLYEWEERLGQPLREQRLSGKVDDQGLLVGKGIRITISELAPDEARAVGNFKRKRVANLTRQKEE